MKKLNVVIILVLLTFATCSLVYGQEFDPLQHFLETGEWITPEERRVRQTPRGQATAFSDDFYDDFHFDDIDEEAMSRQLEEFATIREWESIDAVTRLRDYDRLAFEAASDWNEARHAPAPFMGAQGFIMFPFGAVTPRVTTRPFRITNIALEPGEEIMSIHAGDTVRWTFAPAESMQDGVLVSHVVVQPTMPNISTNLMIHTDRRVYQIDLVSVAEGPYTPGIAFTYPNQNLNRLFVRRDVQSRIRERDRDRDRDRRETDESPVRNINSGYRITTRSTMLDWRPVAVFDDGIRTFIRMPPRITEAPALYIRLDGRDTLVNYRVHGRYFIVDRLFDTAILRLGARSVVIRRTEPLARQNQMRESIERLGY